MNVEDRFMKYVEIKGDLWLWKGGSKFRIGKNMIPPKRAAFLIFLGELDDNMYVTTQSKNELDCNPKNLIVKNQKKNEVYDSFRKEKCLKGHNLDGVRKKGKHTIKYCKTCSRERAKQKRQNGFGKYKVICSVCNKEFKTEYQVYWRYNKNMRVCCSYKCRGHNYKSGSNVPI